MDWCEIFKAGEHTDANGKKRSWTLKDLKKMVETYEPQMGIEAPIVIDHKESGPAYGWVEKLKLDGDRLFAKFKQVVPEFKKMVNDGLFKKRSICVTKDGRLAHVAFLGALPPAIEGLAEYCFNRCEEHEIYSFEKEKNMETKEFVFEKVNDELRAENEKLKAKIAELEKLRTKLEELQEKFKSEQQEFSAFKAQSRRREVENEIDAAIKEGKLLPSVKDAGVVDFIISIDKDDDYEFSGKKVKKSDWFKNFLFNRPSHALFEDFTFAKKEAHKVESKTADEAITAMMIEVVNGDKK